MSGSVLQIPRQRHFGLLCVLSALDTPVIRNRKARKAPKTTDEEVNATIVHNAALSNRQARRKRQRIVQRAA